MPLSWTYATCSDDSQSHTEYFSHTQTSPQGNICDRTLPDLRVLHPEDGNHEKSEFGPKCFIVRGLTTTDCKSQSLAGNW